MKRWVVAALVFTLGLSLTSCGGRKQPLSGQEVIQCDADPNLSGWQFDVELLPMSQGQFQLVITPVTVTADQNGYAPSGDIAIAIANQNPYVVKSQVPLIPGRPIRINLTTDDLYDFDTLIIQPHQTGVPFINVSSDHTTICELPQAYDPYNEI